MKRLVISLFFSTILLAADLEIPRKA